MEASRLQPTTSDVTQTIYLSYSQFEWAKKLGIGDKGILKFNGVVSRETYDDEQDETFKSIDITDLSKKARLT